MTAKFYDILMRILDNRVESVVKEKRWPLWCKL